MPARFIQQPSNKAKFIRWVVYTANAALMVGENCSSTEELKSVQFALSINR